VAKKRDELLDHEVDGIRELDNALPRWWLYGFYFTILFGVAYYVNYHVLETPFYGKATVAAEHQADVDAALRLRPKAASGAAPVTIRTDAASLSRGDAIFNGQTNACHACHRADLGGLVGPNLTDDLWLHGCSPADIAKSISGGFPDKGMQAFGTMARLTDDQVADLVSYVVSRRGTSPANPKAADPERDKPCTVPAP
jgi:cytochrome c oxidase cbb3-type subunit 3